MKKILIALVAIFALTQCKPNSDQGQEGKDFVDKVTEFGLYKNAEAIYAYNIDRHQSAVISAPSYRFVMQTDSQDEYFVAKIDALPTSVEQQVTVDIATQGVTSFKDGAYHMKLVKLTADKAWLWNEKEMIGAVVAVAASY